MLDSLPAGLTFDVDPDGDFDDETLRAALTAAVGGIGTALYVPECVQTCDMAKFCRSEAWAHDEAGAARRHAHDHLGRSSLARRHVAVGRGRARRRRERARRRGRRARRHVRGAATSTAAGADCRRQSAETEGSGRVSLIDLIQAAEAARAGAAVRQPRTGTSTWRTVRSSSSRTTCPARPPRRSASCTAQVPDPSQAALAVSAEPERPATRASARWTWFAADFVEFVNPFLRLTHGADKEQRLPPVGD